MVLTLDATQVLYSLLQPAPILQPIAFRLELFDLLGDIDALLADLQSIGALVLRHQPLKFAIELFDLAVDVLFMQGDGRYLMGEERPAGESVLVGELDLQADVEVLAEQLHDTRDLLLEVLRTCQFEGVQQLYYLQLNKFPQFACLSLGLGQALFSPNTQGLSGCQILSLRLLPTEAFPHLCSEVLRLLLEIGVLIIQHPLDHLVMSPQLIILSGERKRRRRLREGPGFVEGRRATGAQEGCQVAGCFAIVGEVVDGAVAWAAGGLHARCFQKL